MYLWIGCKLPEAFEQEIRTRCLALNEGLGLDTVAFLLPQHISLKISFQTDDPDAVLADLTAFLQDQEPFPVRIRNAEQAGNILWMPAVENATLRALHEQLDTRLQDRFGIPQHEFDKWFLFHSTLFIDPDEEKLARMHRLLSDYPIARELMIDTFLLGQSETGKNGTYRVVREIRLSR